MTNASKPTKKDGIKPGCFLFMFYGSLYLSQGDLPPCNSVFIFNSENGERTLKRNLLSRTKTSQKLSISLFQSLSPNFDRGLKVLKVEDKTKGKRSQVFFLSH